MNNHFTITINDDNGVKQYKLHQIIKKAILYVILFGGIVTLIAVGTILYLNHAVDAIDQKRHSLQKAYMLQKEQNQALDDSIKQANLSLEDKKIKLEEVSQTLSEIETLIGLAPQEEMTLEQRADITKLNSEHMATLMQFIPSGFPIENNGITSSFGYRVHPTLGTREFHGGVDLRANMDTPVHATADGIVEWSGFHQKSGYGNLVIIQHNYGFKSYFGHLNKIIVESGKFVKKGDLIAYSGNTGMSSGPHLHYEIRFVQRAVDSLGFLEWNVKNYKNIFKKEKQIPWQSLINATAHIKVPKPTQALQSSQLALQSQEK